MSTFVVPRIVRSAAILALCAGLTTTTSACREAPEAAAERHFARAQEHEQAGRHAEAILELRNALRKNNRFGEAYYLLGDLYTRMGEPERAGGAFERAAEFLPDRKDVQHRVAWMMIRGGEFDMAKLRAQEMLKRDPDDAVALTILGTAMVGLRDLDAAVAQAEEAVREQPEQAKLFTHLGGLQILKGQGKEAEATLKRASDMDPRALGPRMALASYYWSTGDLAQAETQLNAARRLDEQSAQVTRALALLYLASDRPDNARHLIEGWADEQRTPEARLVLADFYATTGQAARARAIYDAIGERALLPVVATRLAGLDLAENKKTEAYRRLDAARSSAPRDELLLSTLASLLMRDNRLDEARTRVDELLEAHPSSGRGWLYRGRLLAHANDQDGAIQAYKQAIRLSPAAVEPRLELSAIYLARRDTEAAVAFAREAIGAQPNNPVAQLALARAYTARRNFSDARLVLDELMAANPTWVPALIERGQLEAAQGRHAEARRILGPLVGASAPPIEAVAGLVRSQLAEGRIDEANAVVSRELARLPGEPARLMLAASVAQAAGDAARTERTLRRIIEVAPDRLEAYNLLGQLFVAQGRLADARKELEALALRQPRPVGAETMIAMTYEFENRHEDAKRHYERALSLDPRAAVASNNLAWMLARDDEQLGRALELASSAARELPHQAEVIDTLGWVHYRQGASTLAVSHFERALALAPDSPGMRYHLALALERSGSKRRAREAVEAALASKQRFAERADAEALRRKLAGPT